MKINVKILALVASASVSVASAHADNVGGCGWGSKLFDGQKGIAPQVLAVTTNGTSGNQTFGISSGTSGCTQDGVVSSKWKTAAFIDANMNKLALDMSRGQGESLSSLASLVGVDAAHEVAFNGAVQQNFAAIFSNPTVSSVEVAAALKTVLDASPELAQYSANV